MDPPILLAQKKVYILPTRQGVIFAFLLFAMLIGSINYDNSLSYVMTFILSSLYVISILHCYRVLLNLDASLAAVEPVFSGQQTVFCLRLNNRSSHNRYSVRAEIRTSRKPNPEAQNQITGQVNIPAEAQSIIRLPYLPTQRGHHLIPHIVVSSRFPFDWFRVWSNLRFNQHYLVYPKPIGDPRLPHSHEQPLERTKQNAESTLPGKEDFDGLKRYQTGEPLRHVHWKAYARYQLMYSKEFVGTRSEELWIHWNQAPQNNVEDKLSQLCLWVLEANKKGLRYGLHLKSVSIDPGHGALHLSRCLEQLAVFSTHNPATGS